MSTKSTITSAINTFLTSTVTIVKVKGAINALLNEFYNQSPISVLSSASTYATAVSNSLYPYAFLFTKTGGRTFIDGWFRNGSNVNQSYTTIMTITASEYLVAAHTLNSEIIGYRGHAKNRITGEIVQFEIIDVSGVTTFKVVGLFPACATTTDRYDIINASYNNKN